MCYLNEMLPYRGPDEGRDAEERVRAEKERAEMDRFARDLKSRRPLDLSSIPSRLLRLPRLVFFALFVAGGCGAGFAAVWLFDPPNGDGTAQLGTLLMSLFCAAAGAVVGIGAFVSFVWWRKVRRGF